MATAPSAVPFSLRPCGNLVAAATTAASSSLQLCGRGNFSSILQRHNPAALRLQQLQRNCSGTSLRHCGCGNFSGTPAHFSACGLTASAPTFSSRNSQLASQQVQPHLQLHLSACSLVVAALQAASRLACQEPMDGPRFDTDGTGPVQTAATAKKTPRFGCRSQRSNSAARVIRV